MAGPDDVSRILLVATPGGQVTLSAADSMQLLAGEEVVMAQGPTHRNVQWVQAARRRRARFCGIVL
jgi:hypothetical protein